MFLDRLRQNEQCRVVTYGTSLTANGEWVEGLRRFLDDRFPGLVTVINRGEAAQWSGWGVGHLEERVLREKPDVVFIEFAINDAYVPFRTSIQLCRLNLENICDRICDQNPKCQIILMTMNPPIREHLQIRPDIEQYYQVYRDVAIEWNYLLIDHYLAWKEILICDPRLFDTYVPDGIHPNGLGCQKVILPGIQRILDCEK
ncbi:MAG: SGNH/GDSL hydrolase family protein [Phycisphaerae bacterium]